MEKQKSIIVMGVSGCGKSTLAEALSVALKRRFLEGDEFHPQSNVEKMRAGTPLNDEDRWPWLKALSVALNFSSTAGGGVLACSALKRSYRDYLREHCDHPVQFVFCDIDRDLLVKRMEQRPDHYMPVSLLDSQLATLERPMPDEQVFYVDSTQPIAEMLRAIAQSIRP